MRSQRSCNRTEGSGDNENPSHSIPKSTDYLHSRPRSLALATPAIVTSSSSSISTR